MSLKIAPLKIHNEPHAQKVMSFLGVSGEGIKILSSKSLFFAFTIEGIRSWEANIVKQSLLSLGADAAIKREALIKDITSTILIFGSLRQLRSLCEKLKNQPFRLKEIAITLSQYLDNCAQENFEFRARNKRLRITKPIICGILNITPDSFSGDGIYTQSHTSIERLALTKVAAMITDGVCMVDVGAESTRPFSKRVSEKEEIKRLIPVLRKLRKEFKQLIISVDSYKYAVCKAACDEGVDVINDITALRYAPAIVKLVRRYRLGCVLMHMKGTPRTMQLKPTYKNVLSELHEFFKERVRFATESGIARESILIDPGIGFGKQLKDNLTIINNLEVFKVFGQPIFIGASRKSFIGKILDCPASERLIGSVAAHLLAVVHGAAIIRTHDVKETQQALSIAQAIKVH